MAGDPMRAVLEQLAGLERSLDARLPPGRPPTMPSDPAAADAYVNILKTLIVLQRAVENYQIVTGKWNGRPKIAIGFGEPSPRE